MSRRGGAPVASARGKAPTTPRPAARPGPSRHGASPRLPRRWRSFSKGPALTLDSVGLEHLDLLVQAADGDAAAAAHGNAAGERLVGAGSEQHQRAEPLVCPFEPR